MYRSPPCSQCQLAPFAPRSPPRALLNAGIPGTINYRGSRIQLLDMPGIIEGAKDGKGRGRQVIGTARTCDLILIVLDAAKPLTHKKLIEKELEGFGIRLNKRPPNVVFSRKDKGGIAFRSTHAQTLDDETVKAICSEYRIHNAEVQVRQPNLRVDELIDVIEGKNIVYMPVRCSGLLLVVGGGRAGYCALLSSHAHPPPHMTTTTSYSASTC